jgi:UDP-N-acetylmuramyl pentapeptide phosphotransferase/UDP-N-acetylglucosamine-1-phosphate transferase
VFSAFILIFLNQFANLSNDLSLALFSGVIVLAVGFLEDIFRNVSPKKRLFAAMLSAALAMILTSKMITYSGIVQIDFIFSFFLVPIIVTLIWSAGTCHSLNLIDGLNGLSSFYTLSALIAISILASKSGLYDVQLSSIVLIGSIAGFLVFNWPYGRIFLGDGGAYGVGHVLAWLGIILMNRTTEISPVAILLILFWPVADTAFSIIRRMVLDKSVAMPDRLHFHHICVRIVAQLAKGKVPQDWVNPITTLILIPFFSAPAIASVYFWNQSTKALVALLLFAILYLVSYIIFIDVLANRKLSRKK